MKGDKWRRETGSGSDFGNQHAGRLGISMQGDKWRETNEDEEGRFWESACRETNEGRQLKRRWFWESACRETKEGRQMKKGDFGNQHAGRQMKGDKWRRETRSGSDFGNQHAGRLGISMQGDKWRKTNEEGRFWKSACRETNEGRQMKKGD